MCKSVPTCSPGLSLIELIITVTILSILAGMALPVARFTVRRQKEKELRSDLERMRRAIDKYKEACDRGGFLVKRDTYGYPDSLEQLVEGVDVAGTKVKFLREIPVDPMTGTRDWGLRSMQDENDSTSWDGVSVWNVYSKSGGTALDGTKYATW